MNRRQVEAGLHAGTLLTVLGLVAWASGQPFVFPSLGPSAFLLAVARGQRPTPKRVVGGHLVGALAGLLAYSLLAPDLSLVAGAPPLSDGGLRLVGSAVLSVVLTTWGMLVTETPHAPACATTLIVSLGLLSSVVEVGIIVVSVVVLVGVDVGVRRMTARL